METKNIFGQMDIANECLKRVADMKVAEWQEGDNRMRKGDIARTRKYLKEIAYHCKVIRATMDNFDTVATK